MVAPVGKSKDTDRYIPSIDVMPPITQPSVSRDPTRLAYNMPATDGTMR